MEKYEQKLKEREALEGAYGTFVEPYVNQAIALPHETITNPQMGLYCAIVWLLVTLIYITKRR